MQIERHTDIGVSLEDAWTLLVERFHEVSAWASMIDESGEAGPPTGGVPVADRVCQTTQGVFKERLTDLDREAWTFGYTAYEGFPGFVREGKNTWWLEPLGTDRTRVSFRMEITLAPVMSVLMGWMMKAQMGRMADQICVDLKHFAETGGPSPEKQRRVAQVHATA